MPQFRLSRFDGCFLGFYTLDATTIKAKFFSRVKKTNSCWIWMGSKLPHGYGMLRARWTGKKTMWRTHRYSWLIHRGVIPEGMCVLHRCDNPPCVNPRHLFLGTQADNNEDMRRKGRLINVGGDKHWTRLYPDKVLRGEKNGMAVLTAEQVKEIREKARTHTCKELMTEYGVCLASIKNVISRRTYASV